MDSAPNPREPDLTPDANVSFGAHALNPAAQSPENPLQTSPPPEQVQPPASRAEVWLHRFWLVVFVIFCIELGMLLTVIPWTRVWMENSLLAAHPTWRTIFQDDFVRGVISGLGLVDVWIGIWEAVHYKDPGKRKA
jgi:hypothetical protein